MTGLESTIWFLFGAAVGGIFCFLAGVQTGSKWSSLEVHRELQLSSKHKQVGEDPFA